jgi:hypothetical protein
MITELKCPRKIVWYMREAIGSYVYDDETNNFMYQLLWELFPLPLGSNYCIIEEEDGCWDIFIASDDPDKLAFYLLKHS